MKHGRLDIVTIANRGDYPACESLCAELDRESAFPFFHHVYAPKAELALFAQLQEPGRRVTALESLLPAGLWRFPESLGIDCVWAPPFRIAAMSALREILKLSAVLQAQSDIVALIEAKSDLARPLCLEDLVRADRARFYRRPEISGAADRLDSHLRAARLLGLGSMGFGVSYDDVVAVRRRSVVAALVARIESSTGCAWGPACVRAGGVSEPAIHGLFVDLVMGVERAGLYIDRCTLGTAGETLVNWESRRPMGSRVVASSDCAPTAATDQPEPGLDEEKGQLRRAG